MREMKFRYKVKNKKDFIYSDHEDFVYVQQKREMLLFNDNMEIIEHEMQYLGINDSKTTPVYEDDILECTFYNKKDNSKTISNLRVQYSLTYWKPLNLEGLIDYKVIGNFHHNPELLKVKQVRVP